MKPNRNSTPSLKHTEMTCFYKLQKDGKSLYCFHDRAEASRRTIALELHENRKTNYVTLEKDEVDTLLKVRSKINEYTLHAIAHNVAIKKTPLKYKESFSWNYTELSPIFRAGKDRIAHVLSLDDTALLMSVIKDSFIFDYFADDEEQCEYIAYLRRLLQEGLNIINGNPVPLESIYSPDTPTGSEHFFSRKLQITCTPFINGTRNNSMTWKIQISSHRDWILSPKKQEITAKVSMILSDHEFGDILYRCSRVLELDKSLSDSNQKPRRGLMRGPYPPELF